MVILWGPYPVHVGLQFGQCVGILGGRPDQQTGPLSCCALRQNLMYSCFWRWPSLILVSFRFLHGTSSTAAVFFYQARWCRSARKATMYGTQGITTASPHHPMAAWRNRSMLWQTLHLFENNPNGLRLSVPSILLFQHRQTGVRLHERLCIACIAVPCLFPGCNREGGVSRRHILEQDWQMQLKWQEHGNGAFLALLVVYLLGLFHNNLSLPATRALTDFWMRWSCWLSIWMF